MCQHGTHHVPHGAHGLTVCVRRLSWIGLTSSGRRCGILSHLEVLRGSRTGLGGWHRRVGLGRRQHVDNGRMARRVMILLVGMSSMSSGHSMPLPVGCSRLGLLQLSEQMIGRRCWDHLPMSILAARLRRLSMSIRTSSVRTCSSCALHIASDQIQRPRRQLVATIVVGGSAIAENAEVLPMAVIASSWRLSARGARMAHLSAVEARVVVLIVATPSSAAASTATTSTATAAPAAAAPALLTTVMTRWARQYVVSWI